VSNRTDDEPAQVYIWGDGEDNDAGLRVLPFSDFEYAYKLDPSGPLETIYGDRVSKTYRWNEHTRGIFESDVQRETRVLTDLYLHSDKVAKGHRTLFFDIEVSSEGGFASVEKADKEITAIGCYDEFNKRELMWVWDQHGKMTNRNQLIDGCVVRGFDTEAEMLASFMEFYCELQPTILVGWNSNAYDIPYLYHRLGNVFDQDTANMLSPIGIVRFSRMRDRYQIAGVSCLDYFDMYQKFTFARRPSYRLDAIGMYEVGMGKIKYDGTLDQLFETNLPEFIRYNLQDVRIVVAIDKKMKLIDLVKNISHVGHTQYDDYPYSSKYIDGTILVYLHRLGRVAPNKRPEGRDEFDQRLDDNEEGFAGAFVKPPMPDLHEWVFNLDLNSLYPSIIMSLNISPETKVGYVKNWNIKSHFESNDGQYIVAIGSVENVLTKDQFMEFMTSEGFMLSSNGVLYRSDKVGVIPQILDKWFAERIEYNKLKKQYAEAGNVELSEYYDRRQHVQKILLNSIYGVLGLPIFRFYDLDNALAVTATGQDVIKTTSKYLSNQYKAAGVAPKTDAWLHRYEEVLRDVKPPLTEAEIQGFLDPNDHCLYIDTDSVYFSIVPLQSTGDLKQFAVQTAKQFESQLNTFYKIMSQKMFFCQNTRLFIKGEAVCETAFWVAKKRYAMRVVYDLDKNEDLELSYAKATTDVERKRIANKMFKVKGLDVVRSSFPPAFQAVMADVLNKILRKSQKPELDELLLAFRSHMNTLKFVEVARNTSVSELEVYDLKKEKSFDKFPSGCSAHVKAAITYNRYLRKFKLDKIHESIRDGAKIKWTQLKKNELGIHTIALKGYDDPPELVALVDEYMDYDWLYEKELKNKLQDFYDALNWGLLPTEINQSAFKWFTF
jgi:DNA polymerase elongation subunit (family B)